MLCKILFASAGHNLLQRSRATLTKVQGVLNKGYWLIELIIYAKNLKILQNFFHLFLSKLLENSCHFDVPKACNLAFLLEIVIKSIEGEKELFVSKRLQKRQSFSFFGKIFTEKFSDKAENFLGT